MAVNLDGSRVSSWLTVNDGREDVVLITITGGSAAGRSIELWAELEGALEIADSRLVVTDMTRAIGFDLSTLTALAQVASDARRWRVGLCALLRPNSPLEQYARCIELDRVLPIFPSLPVAVSTRGLG